MTNGDLSTHETQANGGGAALVIAPVAAGAFRVYAPSEPSRRYLVTGWPHQADCTCPGFRRRPPDSEWQCEHVLAVASRFGAASGNGAGHNSETEERRATEEERSLPRNRLHREVGQMFMKRSVSPDGRIDALSVEFSVPLADLTPDDVVARAQTILGLQAAVVDRFIGPPLPRKASAASKLPTPMPLVPAGSKAPLNDDHLFRARMLSIGGMDGRYGRRLFITVDVNGEMARLFGSRRQLAEALTAAGYGDLSSSVNEGISFDLPCRVVTKLTPDGRYINIEKVLPPDMSRTP